VLVHILPNRLKKKIIVCVIRLFDMARADHDFKFPERGVFALSEVPTCLHYAAHRRQ